MPLIFHFCLNNFVCDSTEMQAAAHAHESCVLVTYALRALLHLRFWHELTVSVNWHPSWCTETGNILPKIWWEVQSSWGSVQGPISAPRDALLPCQREKSVAQCIASPHLSLSQIHIIDQRLLLILIRKSSFYLKVSFRSWPARPSETQPCERYFTAG